MENAVIACLVGVVASGAAGAALPGGHSATATRCWVDPVWTVDQIEVMSNIQYGSAFNNATNQVEALMLDAYFPPNASDAKRAKRPVAVVVHGGGFDAGSKTWAGDVELAQKLVARGFVAVSIDYRLTGDYWNWTSSQMIYDAVDDARAAVRFVRSVAAAQRLDTDRILLLGESAGAWTSLYLGYVKSAQGQGNSGNPGWSSAVAGVVSISGELKGQGYCDTVTPFPMGCKIDVDVDHTDDVVGGASQPPLLMLHGTADTIVPYVNGKKVYDRAVEVGLPAQLITMPGAPHVPWDVIFNQSNYFDTALLAIAEGIDLAGAEAPPGCTPNTTSR